MVWKFTGLALFIAGTETADSEAGHPLRDLACAVQAVDVVDAVNETNLVNKPEWSFIPTKQVWKNWVTGRAPPPTPGVRGQSSAQEDEAAELEAAMMMSLAETSGSGGAAAQLDSETLDQVNFKLFKSSFWRRMWSRNVLLSGDGNAEEWQHEPRGRVGDGFEAVTATSIRYSFD